MSAPENSEVSRGREIRATFFLAAGVYGFLVITPLYFLEGIIGKRNPPLVTHPEFYYGFVGLALAWQLAFLFIARDPVRLRPMMLPAMLEKFCYPAATTLLYVRGRLDPGTFYISLIDCLFLVLFAISYMRTAQPGEK